MIAAGLSNREIAEQLYLSENTVKTHSGRLFEKLAPSAGRRRFSAAKSRMDACRSLPPVVS